MLEVSSFQLDTAPRSFRPQAAALLNISPDHLDRYPSLAAYAASKAGLFRNQNGVDLKVLNADDAAVAALVAGLGRVYYFSTARPQSQAPGWPTARCTSGWQTPGRALSPGRYSSLRSP